MFAFKPFGGSVVIFIPAWRIDMGNWGVGLELSHNLQSVENPFIIDSRGDGDNVSNLNCGWRVLLAPNISTILSNFGIQLSDKWQLARNTQAPSFAPTSIILQSKYFISDRD